MGSNIANIEKVLTHIGDSVNRANADAHDADGHDLPADLF